jgi:hypothetical protein
MSLTGLQEIIRQPKGLEARASPIHKVLEQPDHRVSTILLQELQLLQIHHKAGIMFLEDQTQHIQTLQVVLALHLGLALHQAVVQVLPQVAAPALVAALQLKQGSFP